MTPISCGWSPSHFLIFSDNVFDPIIYYSHLLSLIISLLIGVFAFWHDRNKLINQIFLMINLFFAIWVFSDLVLWATEKLHYTMFFWSLLVLFEPLIYILSAYFIFIFINERDSSLKSKFFIFLLYLPTIILTPTKYSLLGYDLTNCDRAALEGIVPKYGYLLEILITLWILTYSLWKLKRGGVEIQKRKKEILLVTIALVLFLFSFAWGNIIEMTTLDWRLGQFGLFGLPVFAGLITYGFVRYKIFNVKIIAAQALVWTLNILIASQFLFIKTRINQILTFVTLIISIVLGYFLVKSFKKEIQQKEENARLALDLSNTSDRLLIANEKLLQANAKLQELDKQKTEFVSIASHQLRSPITAIKGYSSMLLDGSFGKINDKATEAISRIFESSQRLTNIIEDFLNITRIELGKMKYEMADIDLGDLVETIINDLIPGIEKKGLKLIYTKPKEKHIVTADSGKIGQVIGNLIDNASKYTPEGTITVTVARVGNMERVSVKDTGIGISKETIPNLFEKFVRADDAGRVNIKGTGLGLYVAKQIIEGHGGKIWAESEGVGKGSCFCFELKAKENN